MFDNVKTDGIIKGHFIRKNKVEILHLQFTDDTLIFCLAAEEVICNYRRILDCFYIMSGLKVN